MPAYALLRLRREFSRLLKDCSLLNAQEQVRLTALLRPALPTDPGLLRRVQQPAPGFVLQIEQLALQKLFAAQLLILPVCFFGRGIAQIENFSRLLECLGEVGLCCNVGRFSIEAIETYERSAETETLWSEGPFLLTPRIQDLSSVLDCPAPSAARFELQTPARLLRRNRPLFQPAFVDIFPFVLRRVTGMLAAWADLEELFEARFMLDCAESLVESQNHLTWQDWRPLSANEAAGGVSGSVVLTGEGLLDIWPLLRIGEAFGIGKGAAFGAGRYILHEI